MDSLLHTLRHRTRPIAGVLALVFLLGSLFLMTPASAKDMGPHHDHAMHMPSMMHHCGHAAPATPQPHHHGAHACCLGAMNCSLACDHSLMASGVIAGVSGAAGFSLAYHPSVITTRSIQPPRRPPKA